MVVESASDRTAMKPARHHVLDDIAFLLMDPERPSLQKRPHRRQITIGQGRNCIPVSPCSFCVLEVSPQSIKFVTESTHFELPAAPRSPVYWQPENASIAALTLDPGVTVRFVLVEVELVCRSDGLQSSAAPPPRTKACASTVEFTFPVHRA